MWPSSTRQPTIKPTGMTTSHTAITTSPKRTTSPTKSTAKPSVNGTAEKITAAYQEWKTTAPISSPIANKGQIVISPTSKTGQADSTTTVIAVVLPVSLTIIVGAVVLVVLVKKRSRNSGADGPNKRLSQSTYESNQTAEPSVAFYAVLNKPNRLSSNTPDQSSAVTCGDVAVYQNTQTSEDSMSPANNHEYGNCIGGIAGCNYELSTREHEDELGDDDNFKDASGVSAGIYHCIKENPMSVDTARVNEGVLTYSQSTAIYHNIGEDQKDGKKIMHHDKGVNVHGDSTAIYHVIGETEANHSNRETNNVGKSTAFYKPQGDKRPDRDAPAAPVPRSATPGHRNVATRKEERRNVKGKSPQAVPGRAPAQPTSIYHVIGKDLVPDAEAETISDSASIYSVAQTPGAICSLARTPGDIYSVARTQGANIARSPDDHQNYNVLNFHGGDSTGGTTLRSDHEVYSHLKDEGEEEGAYNQVDRNRKTDVIDDEYSHVQALESCS